MFITTSIARTVIGTAGAVLLAATCLVSAVTPAAAAETVVRTQSVSYADLNLKQDAGRAKLDARIRAAAKAVCTTDSGLITVAARSNENVCVKSAIASATRS